MYEGYVILQHTNKQPMKIKTYVKALCVLTTFSMLVACGNMSQNVENKLNELQNKTNALDSLINQEINKVMTLDSIITKETEKVKTLDTLIHQRLLK